MTSPPPLHVHVLEKAPNADRVSSSSDAAEVPSLGEIWFNLVGTNTNSKLNSNSNLVNADGVSSVSVSDSGETAAGFTLREIVFQQHAKEKSSVRAATTNANNKRKKRKLTEEKRLDRNAKEQARSNRMSEQFAELRNILVQAGIVVPKGTKGSVLSIVLDYVRLLQHNTSTAEAECQALRQQLASMTKTPDQLISQASQVTAVQSAMSSLLEDSTSTTPPKHMDMDVHTDTDMDKDNLFVSASAHLDNQHYKAAFQHCGVGMALATLGGSFVDANQMFCQLMNQTLDALQQLSIFNLTNQDQLALAFDQLSALLASNSQSQSHPQADQSNRNVSIELRSSTPNLAMHVTLIPDCDLTKIPGDCRRSRLLVTLVQAPSDDTSGSASSLNASSPFPMPSNDLSEDTAVTMTTTTTHHASQGDSKNKETSENSTFFYATG